VTISLSEVVYSGSVQLLCVFIFQPGEALPAPHKIFCSYFRLPLSPRPLLLESVKEVYATPLSFPIPKFIAHSYPSNSWLPDANNF
jgi:hypothetical protein